MKAIIFIIIILSSCAKDDLQCWECHSTQINKVYNLNVTAERMQGIIDWRLVNLGDTMVCKAVDCEWAKSLIWK